MKLVGDTAVAEFPSIDGAICSALMLVERFQAHPAAQENGTLIRVGVNVGEVIAAARPAGARRMLGWAVPAAAVGVVEWKSLGRVTLSGGQEQ